MEEEILSSRRRYLINTINDLLDNNCTLHSRAFAHEILGSSYTDDFPLLANFEGLDSENIRYGGYPEIASLGYKINSGDTTFAEEKEHFISGINRLMQRSNKALETLAGDDVAILGLAAGLSTILKEQNHDVLFSEQKGWLLKIVDKNVEKHVWSYRLRHLAGDLLDNRGRLRTSPIQNDLNVKSLEVCLRVVWPEQFSSIPPCSWEEYRQLMGELLVGLADDIDIERAAIWLKAIDVLIKQAAAILFPKTEIETLAISQLSAIKEKLDKKAERQTNRIIWLYFACVTGIVIDLALLTYRYTYAITEQWIELITAIVLVLSILFFALTAQEPSLRVFYEKLLDRNRASAYKKVNFDPDAYQQLTS